MFTKFNLREEDYEAFSPGDEEKAVSNDNHKALREQYQLSPAIKDYCKNSEQSSHFYNGGTTGYVLDILPPPPTRPGSRFVLDSNKIYLSKNLGNHIACTIRTQAGTINFDTSILAPNDFSLEHLVQFKNAILDKAMRDGHIPNVPIRNFSGVPCRTDSLQNEMKGDKSAQRIVREGTFGLVYLNGQPALIPSGAHVLPGTMSWERSVILNGTHTRLETRQKTIHLLFLTEDDMYYVADPKKNDGIKNFALLTRGTHYIETSQEAVVTPVIEPFGLQPSVVINGVKKILFVKQPQGKFGAASFDKVEFQGEVIPVPKTLLICSTGVTDISSDHMTYYGRHTSKQITIEFTTETSLELARKQHVLELSVWLRCRVKSPQHALQAYVDQGQGVSVDDQIDDGLERTIRSTVLEELKNLVRLKGFSFKNNSIPAESLDRINASLQGIVLFEVKYNIKEKNPALKEQLEQELFESIEHEGESRAFTVQQQIERLKEENQQLDREIELEEKREAEANSQLKEALGQVDMAMATQLNRSRMFQQAMRQTHFAPVADGLASQFSESMEF
jgi:hypothetical protein